MFQHVGSELVKCIGFFTIIVIQMYGDKVLDLYSSGGNTGENKKPKVFEKPI